MEKYLLTEQKGTIFFGKISSKGVGAEGYVFLVGSNQLYEGSYFWSNGVQKTLENSFNFKNVRV